MANLLIIEDNQLDAVALRRSLARNDLISSIEITSSAEAGLATLKKSIDKDRFNLIITDYRLPGMSGLEFCHALRNLGIGLPVILLTGEGNEKVAMEALRFGVEDYVIKDQNLSHLATLNQSIPRILKRESIRQAQRNEMEREALERMISELKHENQALAEFIKTLSHQLNTPLSQLIGFSELLLEDTLKLTAEKKRQYLENIKLISHQAIELVDHLMRKTKWDNGKVERVPCHADRQLAQALDRLEEVIRQKNGRIEIPNFPPPPVLGRPDWIETVWINLITVNLEQCGAPPLLTITYEELEGQVAFSICNRADTRALNEGEENLDLVDHNEEIKSRYLFNKAVKNPSEQVELSVVERIITRLGGKTGFTTVEGRCSGYFFTLEKSPMHALVESKNNRLSKRLPSSEQPLRESLNSGHLLSMLT